MFAKGYTSNWFEEAFRLKKLKILSRGHMSLVTVKKLLEVF